MPLTANTTAAVLRWLAALAALQLALALPDRPDLFVTASFLVLPAELPLIVGLYLLAPPRWRRTVRVSVVLALLLLLGVKLADNAMHAALGRPFNPVLDIELVSHGLDLLGRALGEAGAILLVAIVAALLAAVAWFGIRTFGRPAGNLPGAMAVGDGRARIAAGLVLAVGGAAALPFAWPGDRLPLSAWASRIAVEHAQAYADAAVDLHRFREEAAVDPAAAIPDGRLFAGLRDVDVLVIFAESYGRNVVDPQTGDAEARAALAALDHAVMERGFAARTAWLTSPVRGGQSWLAHATLLSGLRIGNQGRYDDLLAGDRPTLVHDFARAGWRTVAAMPAITGAWPDAGFFGYDKFYAAADLGYRGAPFNWVTMPDQYTLATFAARELGARPGRAPVMAEIALISSHAPWTPIPPLLPWSAIGDGSVFTPHARAGDPPDVVWRDPDRVRAQYRKSIAYVLRTLAAFVETYGRRDMLIVVLGDHQPVPFVAGRGASAAVPVHVIGGDPALLAAFAGWGWTEGAMPDATTPTWPMESLRGRLLDAFTPPDPLSARASDPGSAATRRQ